MLLCLLHALPAADALRFTLATGTSPGQDLNLSLDRVNSARNFTNKLWNAGKFILFNLDKVSASSWAFYMGVGGARLLLLGGSCLIGEQGRCCLTSVQAGGPRQ